jgi:hypothetical protein
MVASLPFKIKARGGFSPTYVAPLKRKQIMVQQAPASGPFKPEPVLAETDYQHIQLEHVRDILANLDARTVATNDNIFH